MFPNDWIIGSVDMARSLKGDMSNDSYSFLIIEQNMNFEGYRTSNMISILNYFVKSTEEIAYDLIILEIVSILIIIILVNAIMSMEIKENVRNISIMRCLGATPKTILYIYMLRAMYISIVGGLLGLCLGVINSYLLVGAIPRLGFKTLYAVYVPTIVLIIPFLIALFSGFIGSIIPLRKATRIEPLEGLQGGNN
jgi:putative ABC transport system permease protein